MSVTKKIKSNRVLKKPAVKWGLGTAASITSGVYVTSDSPKGGKLSRNKVVAARTGVVVGIPLAYKGVKKYRANKRKVVQRSSSGPRKRKR